jgi:hypothetical protein
MFPEMLGCFQMANGSFIVLRRNHRDEYVTHTVGGIALAMVDINITDKMDRIRLAEGGNGHYYGIDREKAITGWMERIALAVGLASYPRC